MQRKPERKEQTYTLSLPRLVKSNTDFTCVLVKYIITCICVKTYFHQKKFVLLHLKQIAYHLGISTILGGSLWLGQLKNKQSVPVNGLCVS